MAESRHHSAPPSAAQLELHPEKPAAARSRATADLFSGAGGFSEGFRQAGFTIAVGNDIDPDACATYADNFPEASTICGDIRDRRVRDQFLEAASRAEIVVGGPPCQAFSQVRNHVRIIDDARNSLYREFVSVVARLLPAAFVMENVPGLDQMGVREQIAQDLALSGEYRVESAVLDAADHGVPQTRRRIVFLGVRSRLGIDPPIISGSAVTSELALARQTGPKGVSRYRMTNRAGAVGTAALASLRDPNDVSRVTAGQALGDLARLPINGSRDYIPAAQLPAPRSAYQRLMRQGADIVWNTTLPRVNEDTRLRLAAIPAGGNHRDLADALRDRYLTGLRWGPDGGTGRLERKHYYAYRRLHPDIWSWTLNTKADSVYHYSAPRSLSVREFARLQSFPDRFVFTTDPRLGALPGRIEGGAGHSRYRQVGNAVPPLLAQAIASAVAAALEGLPTGELVA
jgi:DNA (cytosine-5)-methyltransferase 1